METLELLLPFVMGGAIWPIVAVLKKYVPVRPEFLALVFAFFATWGLTTWLVPEPTAWIDIIKIAVGAVGTAAVLVGGTKIATNKNDHSSR